MQIAEIVALMIPMVGILGGFGVAIFSMHSGNKKREILHEERKIAMEKGLPLPDNLETMRNPETTHKNAALVNRKVFVILFFLGLAFAMFFPHKEDPAGGFIGGVLILLSFAFLIISSFKYKMSPEEKKLFSTKHNSGDALPPRDVEKDEGK